MLLCGMRSLVLTFILTLLSFKAFPYSRFVSEESGKRVVQYREYLGEKTVFENERIERDYNQSLSNLQQTLGFNEAKELINFFLYSSPIPFNYVEDYCYARAHEMAQVMELLGINSGKIIAEGDLNIVDKDGNPVGWKYHIAPTVEIYKDGEVQTFVIDPSLSEEPLTISDWFAKMSPEPCVSKGRFEWYDERDQTCVYYQTSRFYYRAMDLWQEYSTWDPEQTDDAYQIINSFLN